MWGYNRRGEVGFYVLPSGFCRKLLIPPPLGIMNKTASIVLAVVIVVVFVGIGIAVMGGSSNNSSNDDSSTKSADLEYSYKMKEINAYTTSTGVVKLPAEGKIFVIVQEDLICNKSSFYLTASDFALNDNGTSYSYVEYSGSGTLSKGETGTMQQIYEIPATFTKLTVTCSEKGDVKCTTADGFTTLEKVVAVETSITWDYKFTEDVTSFPRVSGYGTETAASGKHFIVLQVIEKNVSYEGGDFKPSLSHFKMIGSDGITYSYSSSSLSYSDDNSGLYDITLGKNTSKTYHIVFEVPSTTSLSSVQFDQGSYAKYLPGQDDNLLA